MSKVVIYLVVSSCELNCKFCFVLSKAVLIESVGSTCRGLLICLWGPNELTLYCLPDANACDLIDGLVIEWCLF